MSDVHFRWGEFKRHPDGSHLHQCGAKVTRVGRNWISTQADGVTARPHASLRDATRYLYANDPSCWAHAPGFGSFEPMGRRLNPSGGFMIETSELELGTVFTARTCERFQIEKFAIRHFERNAFGKASCAKCGLPMTAFRLRKVPYVVDRVSDYPFNPSRDFRAGFWRLCLDDEAITDSTLAWAFVACECGHPIWYHPETRKLSYDLDRAQTKAIRNERVRDADGYYTDDDIQCILKQQEGQCAFCRCTFSESLKYTVDHIVPLASGGTHWPSNICLACGMCNSRKGAMSHAEFLEQCRRVVGTTPCP
jgi:5-methylcytosine-specific restriction endonuclease McrA